jgi:hypothetical protein
VREATNDFLHTLNLEVDIDSDDMFQDEYDGDLSILYVPG